MQPICFLIVPNPVVPILHEIPVVNVAVVVVVVVATVLQLAVEQHVYVIPVPLTKVFVGHVEVSAHE